MDRTPLNPDPLSRRERQIMDAVHRLESATVGDVADAMIDPPSQNAVRTMMGILVSKGYLEMVPDTKAKYGAKVYRPTRSKRAAISSTMRQFINTFFAGSAEQAVTAMIEMNTDGFTPEQWQSIRDLVDQARANQDETQNQDESESDE
ncbi:MAG: BlaI/MecI/CopY family transcriptional regulator [Planctomycetota bacterium]